MLSIAFFLVMCRLYYRVSLSLFVIVCLLMVVIIGFERIMWEGSMGSFLSIDS